MKSAQSAQGVQMFRVQSAIQSSERLGVRTVTIARDWSGEIRMYERPPAGAPEGSAGDDRPSPVTQIRRFSSPPVRGPRTTAKAPRLDTANIPAPVLLA